MFPMISNDLDGKIKFIITVMTLIMISSSITASRIIIFGIGRIQNINPREGQFSFYSVRQKSRDRQQDFRIHDIDGGPVQSVDG